MFMKWYAHIGFSVKFFFYPLPAKFHSVDVGLYTKYINQKRNFTLVSKLFTVNNIYPAEMQGRR